MQGRREELMSPVMGGLMVAELDEREFYMVEQRDVV